MVARLVNTRHFSKVYNRLFGNNWEKLVQAKDDIIHAKDETIRSKEETINLLKAEVLSTKGILNCRSLLEQLLKDVHTEKGSKRRFNATYTCLALGKCSRAGRVEKLLINTASIIFDQFPDNDLTKREFHDNNLTKISKRECHLLYEFVYRRLSMKIHEMPNYEGKVAIPESFPDDWRLLFSLLAEQVGAAATKGPEPKIIDPRAFEDVD